MSKGENNRKTVTIDEDYLVFLHEQLTVNDAKLKEILGDSGAQVVTSASADRLVKTMGKEYSFHPIDDVVEELRSWGIKAEEKRTGDSIELELYCPYAETVHPRLTSKQPVCPLNEYVLGAIRLEDRGAVLVHNELTKDGAWFKIKTSKIL